MKKLSLNKTTIKQLSVKVKSSVKAGRMHNGGGGGATVEGCNLYSALFNC